MAVNEECCLLASDILQPNRDLLKSQEKAAALFSAHSVVLP